MNIAFVVPSIIRSGPIKVVAQLISQLHTTHHIELFYLHSRDDRELMNFDIEPQKIGFTQKIDFDKFDIIHSHTILADAYIFWHKSSIKKAKTVTTLHNYAFEDLPFSYGKLKGNIMAYVWNIICFRHDMVVALSKDAQQYYKKRWLNKQVEFAYNGIDTIDTLCVSSSKEGDIKKIGTIASAGGISYRKGIDQIIKALEKLPKEYKLYIAGKETSESINLKRLIEKLKLKDRVEFLGYVSDMNSFINDMDIFVVSPRSEGFSLALQEIASCKKAIVCSDIAIFRELFQSNEVIFFELENIISLQQAILQCFEQKKILSQNAYEKFINNYTSQQMSKKYIILYKKLVKGVV